MHLLINLIIGLLAYWIADFVLTRMKVADPPKVLIAVLIGLAVFLMNLASQVV